jgi:hypothetical protein
MENETFGVMLKRRWPQLVGAIVALAVLAGLTMFLANRRPDVEWHADALWPSSAGTATSGLVPIVVWERPASDTTTIVPIPGAKVTLYQSVSGMDDYSSEVLVELVERGDTLTELWSGTTDATGAALAALPPQDELLKRERDHHSGSEMGQTHLIMLIERDGQRRALTRTLRFMQGNQLELMMDRPLYQPGQVIKLRALLVDADSGQPRASELRWRARDPRGNLVLDESTKASAAGIGALELALSPQAIQGEYAITVEGGGASASRSVAVQPFRLPAFSVTLDTPEASIDAAGEAAGQVVATYTSGEPVRGADVEVVVRGQTATMGLGVERRAGKTDAQGRMAWAWAPTGGFVQGARLEVTARVVTEAGRAESGSSSLSVRGGAPSFDLIPAERGFFAYGLSNRAFLIIRDASGQPIADAPVVIHIPEERGESKQELRTDAQGRLEMVWRAARPEVPISIEVKVPGRVNPLRQNLRVPYQSGGGVFTGGSVEAAAGQPLSIPVVAAHQARHVLISWQGRIVAHASVAAGAERAEVTLPRWATGLLVALAYDPWLSELDRQPMWVAQPGGDRVTITPDQEIAAPGQQASASLVFGPGDGKGEGVGTTFALVGVDEALYLLREREDVDGYVERLRRMPGGLAKVMQAGVATGGDARDQAIHRARFTQAIVQSSPGWSAERANDRTSDLGRLLTDPARRGWGLLLVLATLALAGLAGWTVVRDMRREAFGFKRLGAMIGVGLLLVPPLIVLSSIDRRGAGLMGGALVWGWVVLGWASGAAWALRAEIKLWRWLAALVLGAFMGLMVVILHSSLYVRDWFDPALGVVGVAGGIALALGLILWPMILMHRKRWHAALGMATFGGALLCAPVLLTFGTVVQSKGDFAPTAMQEAPMRFASAVDGEAEEAAAPAPPPDGIATEGAPGAQDAPGPRVRSYFPETMIWAPEVTADATGKAKVSFEVPDSITTWRLNAWASTSDGRFGTGQASLKVWQSFFVDIDQPVQLTEGDVAELPVTLVNNGDAPVTAQLSAEIPRGGLSVLSAPPASVTVPARSRLVQKMRVRAGAVGPATLRLVARTGEQSAGDAIERPMMIVPDGRVLAASSAGLVQSQWEGRATLPADTIRGTGRADVRVFPGVEAAAMEGMDAMLRQPTGCFEQSSSATYPNVLILQALRQIKPEQWPDGPERWQEANTKALKLANLGYQRMLSFQKPSGGFALYPESTHESLLLTAYGMMQLDELGRVIPVDPNVSLRAGRWIMQNMDAKGMWPAWADGVSGSMAHSPDIGQLRATAWIAGALVSSKHRDEFLPRLKPALDHIVERAPSIEDAQVMALGAWALTMADRKEDAKKLTARLAATVQREGDQAWWGVKVGTWMGGWGRWADLETTAMVAWALLTLEDQAELIPPAFTYLARQRSPWGGWGSTQSTVWALRAMAALRARGSAKDADLTVQLDAAALAQASGRGEPGVVAVRGGQPIVHHLSTGDTLGAGAHTATITSSARTTAIAQLTTTWAVPWSSPGARVEGERLEIEIVDMPRRARFAEDVAAKIVVRNTGGLELGALIVELPLAPGAMAPREGLDAMVTSGQVDHYEVLPTHIRLYFGGMASNGQRAFTWRFTPLVRGAFSYPAIRAYVFYAPEPVTERDGGELVVE